MARKIDANRRGYWLEKITAWQNSGKSAKEWCKENKISFQGLYKWKRKLSVKASRTSLAFLPFRGVINKYLVVLSTKMPRAVL